MTDPSSEAAAGASRFLRAGVDFTNRAELKYAHAIRLANELLGRIGEWSAAETLLARPHLPDPNTLEWKLVLPSPPPVDEWSLILGDVLHNFRSIWDTVIWGFAHLDGAKPRHPSQVAFPMTTDQADWDRRSKTLESVPPELLARVQQLQSWVHGNDRNDSVLWVLHRFDILDKHTGLIDGRLHVDEVSSEWFYSGIPEGHALEYRIQRDPIRAENDGVVATWHCPTHAFTIDPAFRARVRVQFRITSSDDERGAFINKYIPEVINTTREYLDFLLGGDLYARGRRAARESASGMLTTAEYDDGGKVVIRQVQMLDRPRAED